MVRTRANVRLSWLAVPAALWLAACDGGTLAGGAGGRGGGPMGGGAGSIGPNLDCHITRPAPIARLGVLLMLDASASMNDDAGGATCSGGCGATSQWALATSAINTVVGLTASSIDWGLEVFGEAGAACAVGSAVSVPFTAGNSGAIGAALASRTSLNGGVSDGGNRPMRAAEQLGATYLSRLTDDDRRIIVLVTDGAADCAADTGDSSADDSEAAVQAATDAARIGIATSVIGIATLGTAAESTFNRMAAGGIYGQFGGATYAPVSDAPGMTGALRTMVENASTCLISIPPAPNNQLSQGNIGVLLAGAEVPIDPGHTNGWDYTDNSQTHLQLFGAACQAALKVPPAPVEVVYRCEL